MKRLILLQLLVLSFQTAVCQENILLKLSLQKCLQIAVNNNIDAVRSNLNVERARLNWQQERADLLPRINAEVTHGINRGRSINPSTNTYVDEEVAFASPRLNSSLLLFNGMMQQNIIKQYKLMYQSTVEDEKEVKDQLMLHVMLSYLEVLTNQELLTLQQEQQHTTARQLERLEILNKSGAIASSEYQDLKGQYANDQLNLINTRNALENSKISLLKLLNMPYTKNLSVEPISSEHLSLEYGKQASEIYEIAALQLPLVKAATLRKRSSDAQVKASRSANFPMLYFKSSLASNYSNSARGPFNQSIPYFQQYSNNLSKSFSVSVALPLFNSFRTKNAVSLSRINQQEHEALLQNTLVQLQQAVEQAYFNMTSAKERYLSLTEQANAYKESFRTVEIRFNAGALTVVDYLIAKNNLDRANTNLLVNRYDLLLRRKILDFYQGNSSGM